MKNQAGSSETQGELKSIRLALAERGEVLSHVEAPPGPRRNEPHTWHVPGPPANLDHVLPQLIPPAASLHPGPVPTLASGWEDGRGKLMMGLRPGAKQAPLWEKVLP